MAKRTFDFNTFEQPSLELVMMDEAKTVITVTLPTEGYIEQLKNSPSVLKAATKGNDTAKATLYAFCAEVMSFNREGLEITAGDLETKYGLGLWELVGFMNAYLDFVQSVNSLKN